ncbi:uncharacterized protein RAG0_00883 [Rhynchosporium agropyri]|uniref:Uncharacterized protein n=1 Tax=Rhynchosporium agropyri TaxID=914238 RepID=A0A1E1JUK0_9HELO|nr:uncharacterized protein RAG0_00883 [Rhynchosporium agropyri]
MANVESLLRTGWDPDFGGAETENLDIFDLRESPHYFLICLISNFDITAVKIAATNFRVDEGGRRSSKFPFITEEHWSVVPQAGGFPNLNLTPQDIPDAMVLQGSALALPKPQQTAEVLTVQTIMIGDNSNTITKASASKHHCWQEFPKGS